MYDGSPARLLVEFFLLKGSTASTDDQVVDALGEIQARKLYEALGRACWHAMIRVHMSQLEARRALAVAKTSAFFTEE